MNEMTSIQMTISAGKQQFNLGEAVKLTISLKNSGHSSVSIPLTSAWIDQMLTVTDENGQQVPETAYATQQKDSAQAGRRAIKEILPGGVFAESIDLDKAFELRKAGVYTVSTARHVSAGKGLEAPVSVGSNKLTIRIVP